MRGQPGLGFFGPPTWPSSKELEVNKNRNVSLSPLSPFFPSRSALGFSRVPRKFQFFDWPGLAATGSGPCSGSSQPLAPSCFVCFELTDPGPKARPVECCFASRQRYGGEFHFRSPSLALSTGQLHPQRSTSRFGRALFCDYEGCNAPESSLVAHTGPAHGTGEARRCGRR